MMKSRDSSKLGTQDLEGRNLSTSSTLIVWTLSLFGISLWKRMLKLVAPWWLFLKRMAAKGRSSHVCRLAACGDLLAAGTLWGSVALEQPRFPPC